VRIVYLLCRSPKEKIKPGDKVLSHLILAFESPSIMSKDIYAMATLNTLFGGGGSFSSGIDFLVTRYIYLSSPQGDLGKECIPDFTVKYLMVTIT
jgi:hypothetical protein